MTPLYENRIDHNSIYALINWQTKRAQLVPNRISSDSGKKTHTVITQGISCFREISA